MTALSGIQTRTSRHLPSDFKQLLSSIAASSRQERWHNQCATAAWMAWVDLAAEAYDWTGAEARLKAGVTLDFMPEILVRYLQRCDSGPAQGGCTFHAFHFLVADDLQVVVWLEDDCTHAHLVFRGNEDLLESVALQLKLRQAEGDCLPAAVEPASRPRAPTSRTRSTSQ
jgi:hypothetical protein